MNLFLEEHEMKIEKIDEEFSICKVEDYSQIDLKSKYCFIGKTEEENSLVCPVEKVPGNITVRDDGWKAFRIQGVLDFSLVGVLSKITTILAENNIGIFAVSTYNTDYILTKKENFHKALELLSSYDIDVV